jgi:hypothetical protein
MRHPDVETCGLALNAALTASDPAKLLGDAVELANSEDISGFLNSLRRYNHLDLVIALLKDHRPGVRRIAAASLSWVRDARLIPPNCQIGPR